MPDPYRSAFGVLIVDPDLLPRQERIVEIRRIAGALQAKPDRGFVWLGAALSTWLHDGGDLGRILRIAAEKGSRSTPTQVIRRERIAGLMRRLVVLVGSKAGAARVLRGDEDCPPDAREVVAELRTLRAPKSARAFDRAKRDR